jgi:hypothetical protein
MTEGANTGDVEKVGIVQQLLSHHLAPLIIGITVFLFSIFLVGGPINWSGRPFNIFPSAFASGGFATSAGYIYRLHTQQVNKERAEAVFRTTLARDLEDQRKAITNLGVEFKNELEDTREEFREITHYQGVALTALIELLPKEDLQEIIAEKLKGANPKYLTKGNILLRDRLKAIATDNKDNEDGELTKTLLKVLTGPKGNA